MKDFVKVLVISVHLVVNVKSEPTLNLQAPGGDRAPYTGCVQGREVMGGIYSRLPPCPPWVDRKGQCHIGDQILIQQQCLSIMTMERYLSLPRGRPPTIPQPPAFNRPQNNEYRPPGWPSGGSPPGGWPQSFPPGSRGSHYGPPGTNPGSHYGPPGTNPNREEGEAFPSGMGSKRRKNVETDNKNDILPTSIRNLKRYSRTFSVFSRPDSGSIMAPAPPASDPNVRSARALSRRNRNRKFPWFIKRRAQRGKRRRRNSRKSVPRRRNEVDFKLAAPPKSRNKV